MKIEHKLIASNILNGAFIILIGFFAFQSMNLIVTKLRFVEIADDLNASFLEMRLSEKNFFLYHDPQALPQIREKIAQTLHAIGGAREDIVRVIGKTDLRKLESLLNAYASAIGEARGRGEPGLETEARIRAAGHGLKEYSDSITGLERRLLNDIILSSKRILVVSFLAILISALVISHFISQKIVRSLRVIERMTKSIAEGNFHKIEAVRSNDELGALITEIQSMSEELVHREAEIIQSKKLASLGILTAGIAHEITNPLNNISMIAQTYEEVYPHLPEEERIAFMRTVDAETERIRKIVKNLLDFSKPKDAHPTGTDINNVIQKTLTLVQNMVGVSNIELTVNCENGLPPLFIDENQIQQVLVNLITNAVQAMPQGGKLYIGTRTGRAGESVEVSVMDTGKGIPPEFLPHIFDPFSSTKGEGGTGLGLSVSYDIVRGHQGDIRVESKVGVGTTFTVELPIWKGAQEP